MKTLVILSLLLGGFSAHAAEKAEKKIPDFTVQIGQDQTSKMRGWILNFVPPEGHHFNVAAPMSVTSDAGAIQYIKVGAVESHVGFRSSDPKLTPGSSAVASIFLCDQKKTYCVKKTLTFALTVNSDLKRLDFSDAEKPVKKPPQRKRAKSS